MVLFANYKTLSVAADKDGKKHKAQGGKRVMYTSHHPCWDAKNRYGLPDEIDIDYERIRSVIEPKSAAAQSASAAALADATIPADMSGLPKALTDLMAANGVSENDIRLAVSQKNYFPIDMPVKDYPPEFMEGVLIGAWEQVCKMITELKSDEYPF